MTSALSKGETPAIQLDYKTALVIGSRPSHTHACGCQCNSPYCEEPLNIPCQNHNGPPRIQTGYEPWKGR